MTLFMSNVVLPSTNEEAIKHTQRILDKVHNVYFVYSKVKRDPTQPESPSNVIYFTRISAQVYVQYSDFERLAELVPQVLEEYTQTHA